MHISEDLHHDVAVGPASADDQASEGLLEFGGHRISVGFESECDAFEQRPVEVASGVAAVEANQGAFAEGGVGWRRPVVNGEEPVGPDRYVSGFGVEQFLHWHASIGGVGNGRRPELVSEPADAPHPASDPPAFVEVLAGQRGGEGPERVSVGDVAGTVGHCGDVGAERHQTDAGCEGAGSEGFDRLVVSGRNDGEPPGRPRSAATSAVSPPIRSPGRTRSKTWSRWRLHDVHGRGHRPVEGEVVDGPPADEVGRRVDPLAGESQPDVPGLVVT